MTAVEQLAESAVRLDVASLSRSTLLQLKIRILDALGCAIGGFDGDPVRGVRQFIADFSADGRCTLIGGGRSAPDRAALYNGALVCYLDFNDGYLAPRETCHPSDNLGAVLAAAELANAGGGTLLVALAVAYEVQCRLSDPAAFVHHSQVVQLESLRQGIWGTASLGDASWRTSVSRRVNVEAARHNLTRRECRCSASDVPPEISSPRSHAR